jgi:hypothetical protein
VPPETALKYEDVARQPFGSYLRNVGNVHKGYEAIEVVTYLVSTKQDLEAIATSSHCSEKVAVITGNNRIADHLAVIAAVRHLQRSHSSFS